MQIKEEIKEKIKTTISDKKITMEGFYLNEYTYLVFEVGDQCNISFKGNCVQAIILSIKENEIKVLDCNNKKKTISLIDFVNLNKSTHTVIRVQEENGNGPYNSGNKTDELKLLLDSHKNDDSVIKNQPTSIESWGCYPLPVDFKFAFKNYSQLFSWFTLSDIRTIRRSGFSIVVLQKGRDYVDYVESNKQVAITRIPNAYKRMMERKITNI